MTSRSAIARVFGCALWLIWAPAQAEPGARDSAAAVDTEWERFESLNASAGDFAAGVAAQQRGDLAAARDAYRAAVDKDASFVEALVNLARVQVALGELAAADASLDAAHAGNRDYPGVYAARGLVALERGTPGVAIDVLSRARAAAPDDVETLTNLGAALLTEGMSRPAIPVLTRAQRLAPRSAAAAFNLGLAHDLEGEAERAIHHYRHYLALSPRLDPTRAEVEARLAELTGTASARPRVSTDPPSISTDPPGISTDPHNTVAGAAAPVAEGRNR